jgi:hypothetical protein
VSDLQTQVATEALQKKLASVQAELQNTQKALAPGPKAELSFSFAPFPNTPFGQPIVLVTDKTLPLNVDGSVHIDFELRGDLPLKGDPGLDSLNRFCRGLLFQRPKVYCLAQPKHY